MPIRLGEIAGKWSSRNSMAKAQKPQDSGLYWFETEFASARTLEYVNVGAGDIRVRNVRSSHQVGDSFSYYQSQRMVSDWHFLYEEDVKRLTPTQGGYHWLTSRSGARVVVLINKRREFPNGGDEELRYWDCELVGRTGTYPLLWVLEAYQAVRVDFFADADTDYHRSNLR